MHQQTVVSLQDLRFAILLCRHCNTRVMIDLEVEFSEPRSRFYTPRECPRCDTPFDSAVPRSVDAMQNVYQAIAGLGPAVTFTADRGLPPEKDGKEQSHA